MDFDVGALAGRLGPIAERVLTDGAKAVAALAVGQWRGWKYQGWVYNTEGPKRRQHGTSQAAWKVLKVQATEGMRSITVENRAQVDGRSYSAYVHRAGARIEEWRVVWDAVKTEIIPQIQRDLMQAVLTELPSTGAKKVRLNRETTAVRGERLTL